MLASREEPAAVQRHESDPVLVLGSVDTPAPIARARAAIASREAAALAAVVVLAALLRLPALAWAPVALNQDEAVNGYDAYSIGLTLRDHHGHLLPAMLQSFGDWVSPLLTYLTVPFVRLFGLSVAVVRLPVAILGVATVPLLYALMRRLGGRDDVALIAAAILAISPWSVMLSRWAIPPSIVPFFVVLFVLALARAAEMPSSVRSAALAGVAGAALTYAYPAEKLFVPLLLAAAVALFFRRDRIVAAVLIGVWLVLVAPIALTTLTDPARYASRFADVSVFHGEPVHVLAGIVLRYLLALSPVALFGSGDADVQHHLPGFGSTFAFLAPFFYLGVVLIARPALAGAARPLVPRRSAALLVIWLLLSPLPVALTTDYMHVLRGVQGLPLVPIFAAIGIVGALRAVEGRQLRRAIGAVLLLVGGAATIDFTANYLTDYRNTSKAAYQYGLREVVADVLLVQRRCRTVVIDDAINQAYVYLLFYGRRDPRTLVYAQLEESPGTHNIRRLDRYTFAPVTPAHVASAKVLAAIGDDAGTWYRIYQTTDRDCMVQRAKPLPAEPVAGDLPTELKLLIAPLRMGGARAMRRGRRAHDSPKTTYDEVGFIGRRCSL
jgi:4-amino-4-deoxy-L-arabinose transferase-like glycosyltransferase